MPGVASQALNSTQIIVGCDFHNQLPPPPAVPGPHVVTWCIGMAGPGSSKAAPTVLAGPGNALGRQHDCGMGPYHFGVNALLPLVWANAGNKAQFASSSVKLETGNMAVATIPVAGLNLQLDCNDPCARPSSMCIATMNMVFAGFTAGDCLGGFAAMLSDIAVTFVVSKFAGGGTNMLGKVLGASLGRIAGPGPLMLAGVAAVALPTTAAYISGAATSVMGWMIGSPLGFSFPELPNHIIPPGSKYGGRLNDAVNDRMASGPVPDAAPKAPEAQAQEAQSPISSSQSTDDGDQR